jgi:two-component system cell cycle response regulator
MPVVLKNDLENAGYKVLVAEDGENAVDMLTKYKMHIDAIILDREMPGMNGLEVVECMRKDAKLATVPVVMFTGSSTPEQIQEGIDAGIFYYLTKPADNQALRTVIDSALRETRQRRLLASGLSMRRTEPKNKMAFELSVRTLTEAENAACMLAACFPEPQRVVSGIMELLVNAIEHGNLGITYEEKRCLLAENRWREEIGARNALPENKDKAVKVAYQKKGDNYLVQITDAGSGFNWKLYWHINPMRASASHGRGIARGRLTAFDRMAYNDIGNSVTVMVTGASADSNYAW